MKKLEELKISPAPWRKAVNNFGMGEDIIWDANGHLVQYSGLNTNFPYEIHQANHSMIVAAPDLYKELYDACIFKCLHCSVGNMETETHFCGNACPTIKRWHSVLAKAAGESEVKHD